MPSAHHYRPCGRASCVCAPGHILFVLCVLAALLWTSGASAHASLVASTPPNQALLQGAPAQARLLFNEPVSPLALKLIAPDGSTHDLRQVQTIPNGLLLSLPELTRQGTYALSWRVISADGHPVGGTVVFSVGVTAGSPVIAESLPWVRNALIW